MNDGRLIRILAIFSIIVIIALLVKTMNAPDDYSEVFLEYEMSTDEFVNMQLEQN